MAVRSLQRPGGAEHALLLDVTRIVQQATGVGSARALPPEEPLGTLGFDSLALVNAVAAIEGAYGCELPDELWEDRRGITIASLAAALAMAPGSEATPAPAPVPVPAAGEQPGVSRIERLFLQLEAHGVAGRAAAAALHRAVIGAHWARSRQPCVILVRDLTGDLPSIPLPGGVTIAPFHGLSDEPLAGIWPETQGPRMRAHLRRRMEAGIICLAAWENERIVAYDLLGPSGAEDVSTSLGTCFGLNLYERRSSRGRGIGLALLAASLPYTRDLGFKRQATIVLERNRPMLAATTQMLGFAVTGRAERTELFGRVRWTWPLHGSICSGPRVLV